VKRLFVLLVSTLFAAFFIAGCALNQRATTTNVADSSFWHGRLSMQVDASPDDTASKRQSFAASFELSGTPQAGELRLLTPLGSTLAAIRWTHQYAVLEARGESRSYAGLDVLTQDLLGAPVPAPALFAWLQGNALSGSGWQVDLSEYAQGKVNAARLEPLPQAHLRLILEP
jgi:outer membrane lipoprotein LolB